MVEPSIVSGLPWYAKAFIAFGGLGLIWKAIQGSVPKIIEWLTPLALRAADVAVAFVLAYPLLRWLVLGSRENVEKTVSAICDGLESLIDKVEKRVIEDIEAAAAKDAERPPPGLPPGAPA